MILVTALIAKAKEQQQQLCDFKALAFGDIAAFVQLSAEQYEVNLGGAEGNLTLFSFDGKYKVVRQCQDLSALMSVYRLQRESFD